MNSSVPLDADECGWFPNATIYGVRELQTERCKLRKPGGPMPKRTSDRRMPLSAQYATLKGMRHSLTAWTISRKRTTGGAFADLVSFVYPAARPGSQKVRCELGRR